MPQEVQYSTRFATPDWIQREVAQTIELAVYRDGSLVAPSAGTVSVFDAAGDAIVDEETVTVTASIATWAITAVTLPDTLSLSDRWQERWTLTLAGQAYTFWRDAALVRRRLYPVLTDLDLTRKHSELRAWMAEDSSSLQNYIDDAWDDIVLRLMEDARWPFLIMSAWSLRGVHKNLALAGTFLDYSSSAAGTDGKYSKLAAHYEEQYEAGWARLRFTYDLNNDDEISSAEQGVSGEPVLMTNVPGNWGRWP